MDNQKPQRLARMTIYENPWVTLYADRVPFRTGGRIIEAHHVLHFDKEAVYGRRGGCGGRVLLVEAYRYVVDSVQ